MRFLISAKAYDPRFFALVRILLGAYLFFYFLALMPYAGELYASGSIAPPAAANALYAFAPFFNVPMSDAVAAGSVIILAGLSLLLMVGKWRVHAALLIWVGATFLFIRNPLTEDPSMAFINLLLVLTALVPTGEGWSIGKRKADPDWYMPRMVYIGAWIVLTIAYTASGIDRLLAPSWQDGAAIRHIYTLSHSFDTSLTHFLQSLPDWAIALQTYAAMLAFLLAIPLSLHAKTRPYLWLLYVMMFTFIGLVIDLTQVILGILLYQLFLFDIAWVRDGPFASIYRTMEKIWTRT